MADRPRAVGSETVGVSTVSPRPSSGADEVRSDLVEDRGLDANPVDGKPDSARTAVLCGVVGGCGTTALATRLELPETPRGPDLHAAARRGALVILVAPATAHGTAALMEHVTALTEPDRDIEVIVVAMADGRGRMPRAARARLARMRSRAHVRVVPYVTAWRWGDTAAAPDGTRSWRRAIDQLDHLIARYTTSPHPGDTTSPDPDPLKETNP